MARMRWVTILGAAALFLACQSWMPPSSTAAADQPRLTVAAAADLAPALTELVQAFKAQSDTKIALVFGSSGNLAAQIENGAPYDVFFSADKDYPRQLQKQDLIVPGSLSIYARGRLVLFVLRNSPLDLPHSGMRSLLDPRVHRVAIANPQHAPYGRAAVAAMRATGVYAASNQKLVVGENVSQAAQFVTSGNAQIGIIPLSLALAPGSRGQYWEVPPDSYPRLEQAVVILKRSTAKAAAENFLRFLRSPEAAAILRRYGFEVPEDK